MFNAHQFSKDLKIQKVNYKYDSPINWTSIQQHIDQLAIYDLQQLETEEQKKAFWINVYNGATNYLILKENIQQQMKEIEGIFNKKVVSIQQNTFSLNDIEHGILRRNARQTWEAGEPFLSLMVARLDYRIHFALNCGANSCPAIAFYHSETLEEELALAEKGFVEQEFIVEQELKKITCSELFKWYRADFKGLFLDDPRYTGYKVTFKEYDWSI